MNWCIVRSWEALSLTHPIPPAYVSLIHPLSPRGKLVHWGLEGLACTNALIEQARRYQSNDDDDKTVVLRQELYRVATDNDQTKTLQETALQFPEFTTWLDPNQLRSVLEEPTTTPSESTATAAVLYDWNTIQGGLRLSNGCQVIHVPSYLEGLWHACEALAKKNHPSVVQWTLVDEDKEWTYLASGGDDDDATTTTTTNIYCVGAKSCRQLERWYNISLPVQLVRGHSVELFGSVAHAVLSGKYVSPTLDGNVTLIGATHDFKIHDERTNEHVMNELQQRTADLCQWNTSTMHRITSGVRVQSSRSAQGRRPIVGRIGGTDNAWIFTGLSSRGLLYHGIYGEKLARAIWEDNEDELLKDCPDILWWKR
jgi:glycine/D-amino acid oxidase-like deaminating enzyme